MRDRNRDTREQPERDESLLAVRQPIIDEAIGDP